MSSKPLPARGEPGGPLDRQIILHNISQRRCDRARRGLPAATPVEWLNWESRRPPAAHPGSPALSVVAVVGDVDCESFITGLLDYLTQLPPNTKDAWWRNLTKTLFFKGTPTEHVTPSAEGAEVAGAEKTGGRSALGTEEAGGRSALGGAAAQGAGGALVARGAEIAGGAPRADSAPPGAPQVSNAFDPAEVAEGDEATARDFLAGSGTIAWIGPDAAKRFADLGLERFSGSLKLPDELELYVPGAAPTGRRMALRVATKAVTGRAYLTHIHHVLAEAYLRNFLRPGDRLEVKHEDELDPVEEIPAGNRDFEARIANDQRSPGCLRLYANLTVVPALHGAP